MTAPWGSKVLFSEELRQVWEASLLHSFIVLEAWTLSPSLPYAVPTEATVSLHTVLLGTDDVSTFILLSWEAKLRVTCPLEKQGQVGQCTRRSKKSYRNTPAGSRKGSELSTAILDKAICLVDRQSVAGALHVWGPD